MMRRALSVVGKPKGLTVHFPRRSYSESNELEWVSYGKQFYRNGNVDCTCLKHIQNLHRDPLLHDMNLPWHSIWYYHVKDAIDLDTGWLEVFKTKPYNEQPVIEGISHAYNENGPYGNCGRYCCGASENLEENS